MTTTTAADLARIIYENKAELSLDDGFASKIEPAPTDKDSFIIAHPGAAEYINDGIKSSIDRYSDTYISALARCPSSARSSRRSTPRSRGSRRNEPASLRRRF